MASVADTLRPIPLGPLPDTPLVSVLVANCNYGRYIGEAIESVLAQTYTNWELVICDDGSTDNSCEVVKRYQEKDPRIKLIRKENGGQASALNVAYASSRGEIVALLDSDDKWFSGRLDAVVAEFLAAPKVGLVCHSLCVVDSHGRVLKDRHPRRLISGWHGLLLAEGHSPVLPPASGLSMRREVAELVFPLPIVFRSLADLVLRERAALVTEVGTLRKVLGLYRQHGNNVTGAAGPTSLAQIERAIEKVEVVLKDRAEFLLRVHGLKVDPGPWRQSAMGGLGCARALLTGERRPDEYISSIDGVQRQIWSLLFALPRPLAVWLFRMWWGEWYGKRWLRRYFPTSRW